MAYEVSLDEEGENFAIVFKATGAAPEANIIFTPDHGGDAVVIAAGAVEKGLNTVYVAKEELEKDTKYSVSIEVVSNLIPQAGVAFEDASGLTVRGSVIPITDTEYASFGYVAVGHGANKGVDIYDPAGEKIVNRALVNAPLFGGVTSNKSNPFRGNEHKGYAVMSTWGDAGYGMVAVNPLDVDDTFTLFAGTKNGTGNFVYEGQNLGGGNSGFAFVGEGEDCHVISFSEDHQNQNGSGDQENTLQSYELGSGWQITKAPTMVGNGYNGFLANTNVDIVSYGNGVFVSQVRGAGNNASGCPMFGYIGDVVEDPYIAMTSADGDLKDYLDNGTSGIAITVDGKTFASAMGSSIAIMDVEWKDGDPTMTYKYSFPIESNTWSCLRFDAAGNLHAYLLEGGYRVYSLPSERPVAVTPTSFVVTGTGATGIQAVEAENVAKGEAIYFNLNGIRVQGNMPAGIYIKVVDGKAEKVVVK